MKTERTRIIGKVSIEQSLWMRFLKALALVLVNLCLLDYIVIRISLYQGLKKLEEKASEYNNHVPAWKTNR